MSRKFGKNREVDRLYLNVPLKYCNGVNGSNDFQQDKEFVIIDDYGKYFLCGWRNNDTLKVGMTFLCKKGFKNGKLGFYHKNKFHKLTNSGWVIY